MNRSTRWQHITVQPKRITVQRPLGVPRLLGAAALSLVLVPAHGALGAVGKAAANAGQTKNVASAASSMLPTRVSFDGTLVTASNVDSFAKDPVLAFGPGVDADGHTIPGEMWVIVAKDAKAIFYELTEQHASGTGSYAGCTVKVKTVTTHGILNYGAGEDVPVIGNDEDGFVVATTELLVSSKFVSSSGPKCMTTSGQPCAPTVSMLTAGTVVQVANIPASMSAGGQGALQVFDAAGNLVEESSGMAIASSSSSGDCRDFADGLVNTVESVQDTMLGIGQGANLVLNALAGGATGAIAGTGAGAGVQSASG